MTPQRNRLDLRLRAQVEKRRFPAIKISTILRLTTSLVVMLCVLTLSINSSTMQDTAQASQKRSKKPNILLIMTDDQDANSIRHMPAVRRYLKQRGTTFPNFSYVDPLCCPSRASILTGMYPHNHGVHENRWPNGGFREFKREGNERKIFPIPLRRSGYTTAFFGKYMNQFNPGKEGKPRGWEQFDISVGRKSSAFNINGRFVNRKQFETTDRGTAHYAERFIRKNAPKKKPVFMFASFYAPHSPYKPFESRYKKKFRRVGVPRPPSFNEEDVSDKPSYVRANKRMTKKKIRSLNRDYRNRLRQLMTINGFVKRAVKEFARAGELNNTYIIFVSDNGYMMGEHRLMYKRHAYTESSSFPLIVRGPGVASDKVDERVIANIDLAPTLLDIANARQPRHIDGASFLPLLGRDTSSVPWREALLLEDYSKGREVKIVDSYKAIRTEDQLYTEYSTGEKELYDLAEDPYQLENIAGQRPEPEAELSAKIAALKNCAGEGCRVAEN